MSQENDKGDLPDTEVQPIPTGARFIVGDDLEKEDRRKRERQAASYLHVEYAEVELADDLKAGLRGILVARATSRVLSFTQDWSLFSAIAIAMDDTGHGFWCTRTARNSSSFVVLHYPSHDDTLRARVATDPLQSCRLSHDTFNQEQSIQLLVFQSNAHYYGRRAALRRQEEAPQRTDGHTDPYSRDPGAYQNQFYREGDSRTFTIDKSSNSRDAAGKRPSSGPVAKSPFNRGRGR